MTKLNELAEEMFPTDRIPNMRKIGFVAGFKAAIEELRKFSVDDNFEQPVPFGQAVAEIVEYLGSFDKEAQDDNT